MSKRKTVDVLWLLQKANHFLENTPDENTTLSRAEFIQRRQGVCSLLEMALMETGQYAGFGYIGGQGRPSPSPEEIQAGNYDDSRRQYGYSNAMVREAAKAREKSP